MRYFCTYLSKLHKVFAMKPCRLVTWPECNWGMRKNDYFWCNLSLVSKEHASFILHFLFIYFSPISRTLKINKIISIKNEKSDNDFTYT